MTADITLAGERLVLRADRSLFWPARRTLVIADTHFGKSDAFRAAGIPLPGGLANTLNRLDSALDATRAERLIVLGDFWHVRTGRTEGILSDLKEWRERKHELHVELIRGNHDRAGPAPDGWSETWHSELIEPPFRFSHFPTATENLYVLAGHLHPGVSLQGRGRDRLKLPCFWFGSQVGVLPAFNEFTGLQLVSRQVGTRTFAIAENEVVDVSGVV